MLLVATLTIAREALDAFRAYERAAARIMARHGGAIERALVLDDGGPTLRELHVVQFPSEEAFAAYRADPTLVALAPERARCVLHTELAHAVEGPRYVSEAD